MTQTGTALRICPLCEATCGLTLTIDDGRVTGARGDREDVFSQGFICPKGASFAELDNDPDRLARPMVRRDGVLIEATWHARPTPSSPNGSVASSVTTAGRRSGSTWAAQPHAVAGALYPPLIVRGLGLVGVLASTPARCPTCRARPDVATPVAFTVPDLDRTNYLVLIGANPLVSNGSLATAADFPGKLRGLRKRGGPLVVIDPARTRTAELADRHLAPRPGTDAALLLAIVHVLFDEALVELGRVADYVTGVDDVRALAPDFAPETVADHCGVDADEIRTSPGSSPPRRRLRSTAESAPPQSNSAPSAAGSSTSSTS